MTHILIQVSLKSKRCPNKALADLAGEPLIWRLHERISRVGLPIIWCFRTDPQDDPLEDLAKSKGVNYYRGHWDAMWRLVDCCEGRGIKKFVRVTGDNPLTDPTLLAEVVTNGEIGKLCYVDSKAWPGLKSEFVDTWFLSEIRRTLSILDTEKIFSKAMSLYAGWLGDGIEVWPDWYDMNYAYSFTVDTPEDLEFVRSIYEKYNGYPPGIEQIIKDL